MSDNRVVVVTVPLPELGLSKLQKQFRTVYYCPKGDVPPDAFPEVELWLCGWFGLPESIGSPSRLPRLKHIQLSTAGADKALRNPLIKEVGKRATGSVDGRPPVTMSTAAGVHVLSIPNYVVAMIINISSQMYRQVELGRRHKDWPSREEVDQSGAQRFYNRKTYGRTAGFLGYGALGRESARLCKALGMRIIAANTSGQPTPQDGVGALSACEAKHELRLQYIIPGTGDADGSLPQEYFSTSDPQLLERFLGQSDVLVCSMPSTPRTVHLLDRRKLALLPKGAILINVGRGDLIESGELEAALDVPDHLLGAAIDVTDPEPLPKDHPLWSHPKLLITPHLSGDAEGEFDLAVDVFLANAQRLAEGKAVLNRVDFERGY